MLHKYLQPATTQPLNTDTHTNMKFPLQKPAWEVGAVPTILCDRGVWQRVLEADLTLLAPCEEGLIQTLQACTSSTCPVTIAPWECSAEAELTYFISKPQ